ncbi:Na(+)-translocating NADH-quinone reductase subunit C [bacterium]|nr:Na(+)-translocating NADH-quinone reductase subunit C [bacterium]
MAGKGKDSVFGTIGVALALCLVCSVIVSFAAVYLKPVQQQNKTQDRKKNILAVVGMYDPSESIDAQFEQFETRVVELDSGDYAEGIDPANFDGRKAAADPATSHPLSREEDIAGIKRRADHSEVYLVRKDDGSIRYMVLPVHGYGLWSTLYGFLALEGDGKTIVGLSFYDHAETPGLGGEVDNPKWKAQWAGKLAYDEDWTPEAEVLKGPVNPSNPDAEHQVDGLAGATLTSRGVTQLLRYWLSDDGFKPFIQKVT